MLVRTNKIDIERKHVSINMKLRIVSDMQVLKYFLFTVELEKTKTIRKKPVH